MRRLLRCGDRGFESLCWQFFDIFGEDLELHLGDWEGLFREASGVEILKYVVFEIFFCGRRGGGV